MDLGCWGDVPEVMAELGLQEQRGRGVRQLGRFESSRTLRAQCPREVRGSVWSRPGSGDSVCSPENHRFSDRSIKTEETSGFGHFNVCERTIM